MQVKNNNHFDLESIHILTIKAANQKFKNKKLSKPNRPVGERLEGMSIHQIKIKRKKVVMNKEMKKENILNKMKIPSMLRIETKEIFHLIKTILHKRKMKIIISTLYQITAFIQYVKIHKKVLIRKASIILSKG